MFLAELEFTEKNKDEASICEQLELCQNMEWVQGRITYGFNQTVQPVI